MHARSTPLLPSSVSRYTVFGQIGAGGMATVEYAEVTGPAGFARAVAIKRLHPHMASDPVFTSLFLDEARLSARIAHVNVVATIDVLSQPAEIAVVMEYVHGESLAGLLSLARAQRSPLPYKVAGNLLVGVLHGLHAAHETLGEHGEPLGIVHRDVSPENILVGSDGVARLLDFGIAKAKGRARATPNGELKGKLGYMAPEQYDGLDVDRRADVYGASVVLWEALTGRALFAGVSDAGTVRAVLHSEVLPPSALVPEIPPQLDALVLRGLSRQRDLRFATAREMALVLEREVGIATQSEVSDWLHGLAGELLEERAAALVALRKRAQGRDQEAARERGTRRLAATLTASAPTRAQAVPERAGEGARSGTRVRRPASLLFGLALLALLSGGAWLASALHSAPHMPATPPVHAPSIAGRAAPATPPREARGFAREQNPEAVPSVEPETPRRAPRRSATTGGPVASKSDSSRAGSPAKATPEKVRAARKRVDCSQPYEVDAQGIRRWKRQCL